MRGKQKRVMELSFLWPCFHLRSKSEWAKRGIDLSGITGNEKPGGVRPGGLKGERYRRCVARDDALASGQFFQVVVELFPLEANQR